MAELYDASDELDYDIREKTVSGSTIIEDSEDFDAVIEVGSNYWGIPNSEDIYPVYVRAENEDHKEVVLGLSVADATKLRDAIDDILDLYRDVWPDE